MPFRVRQSHQRHLLLVPNDWLLPVPNRHTDLHGLLVQLLLQLHHQHLHPMRHHQLPFLLDQQLLRFLLRYTHPQQQRGSLRELQLHVELCELFRQLFLRSVRD